MDLAVIIRLVAALLVACGIYLLQAAWRARTGNALRLAAGWGALFASIPAWAVTTHPDKGAAYGTVSFMLAAMAFLVRPYLSGKRRPANVRSDRIAEASSSGWGGTLHQVTAGFLIGPVAGLSALALCTAGFATMKAVGVEHTANMVAAMITFPLLWAGLAVLAGFDPRLWRKGAIIVALGLAPAAWLVLSHFAGNA